MAPLDTTMYSDGGGALGIPTDQLILYDTVILDWLKQDYNIIPGKQTFCLISTPQIEYAEVPIVSSPHPVQGRHTIPRITVTRGDHTPDPARFRPVTIPRLGRYVGAAGNYRLRQAQHPVPVIIPYQVDFWCEFVREANLWEQKLLFQFAYQYKYFSVTIDSVWGTKKFIVFLEGAISDQSNLEPGPAPRLIRKVANLRAEAWIYDQTYAEVGIVKRAFSELRDYDTGQIISSSSATRNQVIYTSPGGQTTFSGALTKFVPILKNTFVLAANFSGVERVAEDNGLGVVIGPNVTSGTIDYATGAVSVVYAVAPDAGDLLATWLTDLP